MQRMTTIYELPQDLQRSFLAGYAVPEMAMYELKRDRAALDRLAEEHPVPEAFKDGVALVEMIAWVYSADTTREYEVSIKDYDTCARAINERYGDIVLPSSDPEAKEALGLRGFRKPAFSHLEEGVRLDDGTFTVTHTDLAAEIAAEDHRLHRPQRG
jgi:hypothetical protein